MKESLYSKVARIIATAAIASTLASCSDHKSNSSSGHYLEQPITVYPVLTGDSSDKHCTIPPNTRVEFGKIFSPESDPNIILAKVKVVGNITTECDGGYLKLSADSPDIRLK